MVDAIKARLAVLKIALPDPTPPVANFVPCVQLDKMLFISGQPSLNRELKYLGKVGKTVTLNEGYLAARVCGLNVLALAEAFLGTLDRVVRVCQVSGFVNSAADFNDHPAVINGASDLFCDVFGERGKHARLAVGASSLPLNAAVEVAAVFEVR